MFAAHANIASAEQNAEPHLLKLRFTRSAYEWARGIGEVNTYTLNAPRDDTVGYWDGGTFTPVE